LEDEVRSWRQTGLDVIVSLLTRDEVVDLDLAREAELCQANGLQFISFPVTDRGVPVSRKATLTLVENLNTLLAEGKNLAIHCRQGIGRSAVIATCLLIFAGMDAATALRHISAVRGCPVPETAEQQEWITAFAQARPHVSSTFQTT
jgi:protein-tyrosine phosphatase